MYQRPELRVYNLRICSNLLLSFSMDATYDEWSMHPSDQTSSAIDWSDEEEI